MIKTIFTHNIYTASIDLPKEYNERLKDEISKFELSRFSHFDSDTTYWKNRDLHKEPIFEPLISEIDQHVQKYSGLPNVVINSLWFSVSGNGQYHSYHEHGAAIVSGVYYVSAPSDIQTFIDFMSPNGYIAPREYHEPIESNKLILFEGWMLHGFEPNPSREPRITIAFNYSEKF